MISEQVTIYAELPDTCDGYRIVGVGRPRIGEWYFSVQGGAPVHSALNSEFYAVILEPIERWRPAELNDLHSCLGLGSMRCQATCGGRVVQGELLTGRRCAGGFQFFVRVGDSLGWYSVVEVLDS